MAEPLTSDEIERDIEMERVALARSIDELQRTLSPDAFAQRATTLIRDNGGEIVDTAVRQIRENPMALALTSVGLTWLMVGPVQNRYDPAGYLSAKREQFMPERSPRPARAKPSVTYDHRTYETVSGFRRPDPDDSFETRMARAETRRYDPAIRADADRTSRTQTRRATGKKSLRDRLIEGTETMTDAARDRVMAAREAAFEAEQRLEARARQYSAASRDAYSSQPLMGALVAFGVGAVIGGILPRTQTEDRHLGAARDRALVEAERVYRQEVAGLRAKAETIAEDTMTSAADALKSAVPGKNG